MSKLSYEDKIDIYNKKKNGQSRKPIASKYKIRNRIVMYLVRFIDRHGFDILRKDKKIRRRKSIFKSETKILKKLRAVVQARKTQQQKKK